MGDPTGGGHPGTGGPPSGPAESSPPGSGSPGSGLSAGKVWRIRDRATFALLREEGRRVRRGPVSVTFAGSGSAEPPKVAYAVGRRAGNAVRRNRVRRRLRAVVADLAPQMRPGAYLVSATAEAAELPFGELKAVVYRALQALDASSSGDRT